MARARALDAYRQALGAWSSTRRPPSWRRCIQEWSTAHGLAATTLESLARLTALPDAAQALLDEVSVGEVSLSTLLKGLRNLPGAPALMERHVVAAIAQARGLSVSYRNPVTARAKRWARDPAGGPSPRTPEPVTPAPVPTSASGRVAQGPTIWSLSLPPIGNASPAIEVEVRWPAAVPPHPLTPAERTTILERASLELEAAALAVEIPKT